jgi:hypothetical protein
MMPQVKFIGRVMTFCSELTAKLEEVVIEIQKKRRLLEEVGLKDAVATKNAALAIDWIRGRRLEQEAKEIEAQVAAEEAEARRKKAAAAKKGAKGKKGKAAAVDPAKSDGEGEGKGAKPAAKKKAAAPKGKAKEPEKLLTEETVKVCTHHVSPSCIVLLFGTICTALCNCSCCVCLSLFACVTFSHSCRWMRSRRRTAPIATPSITSWSCCGSAPRSTSRRLVLPFLLFIYEFLNCVMGCSVWSALFAVRCRFKS